MSRLASLLLVAFGLVAANQDLLCKATTKYGDVQGSLLDGSTTMCTFRGIPYAQAPVHELRWADPKPASSWAPKVLNASNFGATCLQPYSVRDGKVIPGWPSIQGVDTASEDCLFINIYSPLYALTSPRKNKTKTQDLLPVAVYIHAGEFSVGSSNDLENNHPFTELTLLVTFNYRLGIFGYLAADYLRPRTALGSTGNYGLLDQRLALKWVQDNIASFGGDPSMVTIFGESSGGSSVGLHLTNPASWPLFQNAILESPGLTQVHKPEEGRANQEFIVSLLALTQYAPKPASCVLDAPILEWNQYTGAVFGPALGSLTGSNLSSVVQAAKQQCDGLGASCLSVSYSTIKNQSTGLYSAQWRASASLIAITGTSTYQSWVKLAKLSDDAALACLLESDAKVLLNASQFTPYSDTYETDQWAPVIDGVELPRSILDSIRNGTLHPTANIVLGSNLDEGTIFLGETPPLPCQASYEVFQKWAEQFFGPDLGKTIAPLYRSLPQPVPPCAPWGATEHLSKNDPDAIGLTFLEQTGGDDDSWDGHQAAMRAAGDFAITCTVRELARALAQRPSQSNVFLYTFNHQPATSINYGGLVYLGAFHGAEIQFVFNDTFEIVGDGEKALAAAAGCYWESFVGSGDVNERLWRKRAQTNVKPIPYSPCDAVKRDSAPLWPQYTWSTTGSKKVPLRGKVDLLFQEDLNLVLNAIATDSNITITKGLRDVQCDAFGVL